jgi:transcriptional regulator with XRE-family HTH domain
MGKRRALSQQAPSLQPFNLGIGQRLKTVRRKARLRQPDFAERLGLSPRAYSNYERGERAIPAQALKALHDLFQVDLIWLLSGPERALFVRTPLRPELLVKLIVKVEQREAQSPHSLSPAEKARLIVTLLPHCQARGRVEDKFIENAFSSTSGGSAKG